MSTFGENLLQFAETAHAVSQEEYFGILNLIRRHLSHQLDAVFFAVVVHKVVKHQAYLFSEYPTDPWWDALVSEKGQYKGQTALGYALAKPVWIVGKNREDLDIAQGYIDLLGNVEAAEIPQYARITDVAHVKTSIILPLTVDDHQASFGVMNVESKTYLRASDMVLRELKRIARAVSVLRHTRETTDLRTRRTADAKERLVQGGFSPILGQQSFFAHADTADDAVLGAINQVLEKFETYFDVVRWTQPSSG